MQFYTQEQMVNKHVGAKGTPARAEYDEQIELMQVSLDIPSIGRVALW